MNIVEIAEFYDKPLGHVAQGLVSSRLQLSRGTTTDQLVMGLGYPLPYMKPEGRNIAFMMARSGVVHWPQNGAIRSALVDELDLPLTESCVDVALLIHALEFAESAEDMLAEVWRVLSPQGRLVLVVPNRRGLWSSTDVTPFGQGQPFSRSQVMALLKAAQFTISRVEHSLMSPPWLGSGLAKVVEPLSRLAPRRFSGVVVVEAQKQIYAYSTGKPVRRIVPRLKSVLLPSPHSTVKT
jgi:SAM-dependent methyltransferase